MMRILALVLMLLVSACGLRPLYSGGGGGKVSQVLRSVDVTAIDGKAGWLMRNALNDRLGRNPAIPAQYRLEVELDDQISGFGVRRDDAVTRERRTLRARYRLVDAAQGTVVLDATAGSDAGIDVVVAGAVEVERDHDLGLARLSLDHRGAHGSPALRGIPPVLKVPANG